MFTQQEIRSNLSAGERVRRTRRAGMWGSRSQPGLLTRSNAGIMAAQGTIPANYPASRFRRDRRVGDRSPARGGSGGLDGNDPVPAAEAGGGDRGESNRTPIVSTCHTDGRLGR
ncbi:hypothetical protein GCM10010430_53650 [Kitasatospora cystarginea]|uniref:Uncharacterized protein n=1 Tax=Kitasatospora cystarginea TaxID=58350 RepID=A0ABP5RIA6_9ACTN